MQIPVIPLNTIKDTGLTQVISHQYFPYLMYVTFLFVSVVVYLIGFGDNIEFGLRMVLFFLLDGGYMNMYSCELINLAQKLVRRENFTQQNDRAFVKRLVWLLLFIEITNTDSFDLYRCATFKKLHAFCRAK